MTRSGGFEHRDVEAALSRDGRDLETDVARADEQHARARRQRRRDGVDVGDRAQVVHAGQLRARHGERARTAAGREQQAVVRERAAVARGARARAAGLELLDARVLLERHALLCVERRGPQQQPLARELAREILLRQRRALIRRIRLVAERA